MALESDAVVSSSYPPSTLPAHFPRTPALPEDETLCLAFPTIGSGSHQASDNLMSNSRGAFTWHFGHLRSGSHTRLVRSPPRQRYGSGRRAQGSGLTYTCYPEHSRSPAMSQNLSGRPYALSFAPSLSPSRPVPAIASETFIVNKSRASNRSTFKRLMSLAKFNPFRRFRAESTSSVVDKDTLKAVKSWTTKRRRCASAPDADIHTARL